MKAWPCADFSVLCTFQTLPKAVETSGYGLGLSIEIVASGQLVGQGDGDIWLGLGDHQADKCRAWLPRATLVLDCGAHIRAG